MIEVYGLTQIPYDTFTESAAGEEATLIAGMVIHPSLSDVIPLQTTITPLTSTNGRHVYRVVVRDYTVKQFIAIATAYSDEQIERADRSAAAQLLRRLISPADRPTRTSQGEHIARRLVRVGFLLHHRTKLGDHINQSIKVLRITHRFSRPILR
jgi:hypothetical protein